MSKRFAAAEFYVMLDQWLRVFSPVTGREQDAWESDWTNMLKKLPYLKLVRKHRNWELHHLLGFRCQMNFSGGNLEICQSDLERIWTEDLAAELDAGHAVVSTPDGFDFQFGALTSKNTYITGTLSVHKKK